MTSRNRHFADIYFGNDKPKNWEHDPQHLKERKDVENLTAQFMSKLFPQEQRIYLPEYSFVGTDNRPHLCINPEVFDEEKKEITVLHPFSEGDQLPVKEFMLRLIAHRTGVYFDAAGTKRHFFESRNLRELGEVFQIINRMIDPDVAKEENPEREKKARVIRAENAQKLLQILRRIYSLKVISTTSPGIRI